jgi:hypothetical protein
LQSALRTILTFAAVAFFSLRPASPAESSQAPQPPSFVAESHGFCPNGFYYRDSTDFRKAPQNQELWGSYCGDNNKDQNTGSLKTTTFPAPSTLQLYLAGYPSRPGLLLEIENVSDGSTLPIRIFNLPHESWRLYRFSLPAAWRGKPVRLVAEDRAVASAGWFALTRPEPARAGYGSTQAMLVVKPLILSFLLMSLFFYAGCSLAARLGFRSVVLIGLSGLAAIGLDGYLSFWLWFFSPSAARWSNLLLPFLAAIYLFRSFRTLDSQSRQALRELLVPLGLVCATSLLVASTGFLYGGLDDPFETASLRFSHPLPPDNTIPFLFAEGLVNGHVRRPLLADWLSSDRPPLQTGIYLSQRRYFVHELPYVVVSIVIQSFWILSLWLFSTAFRISPRALSLILLVCVLDGFIFLNNFYTWPKLIAASYVVGFAALLLPEEFYVLARRRWPVAALAGLMFALGMLSHGGSMFGIAGVVLACLLMRRSLDFKPFSLILASAFLLYLPWTLYQKFYEPPGDRLLKYHLAGVEQIDKRSFGQVTAEAYGKLTLHDWATGRIDNLLTIVDYQSEYWRRMSAFIAGLAHSGSRGKGTIAKIAEELRGMNFFFLFPSIGPLLSAMFALAIGSVRRINNTEWKTALSLWLFVACSSAVWCLLMFKPGSTVLHQGTYALVLLSVAASILTLWALSPAIAVVVGSLNAALHMLLYVVFMRQSTAGETLQENSLDYGLLTLAIFSLAGIVLILWRLAQGRRQGAYDLASRGSLAESTARP